MLLRTDNQSPHWHWSKDFAEHLRTIHFTLLSVSTGLILIASSIKTYNPVVAARQIHQIQELKKLWKPEWIASKGIKKSIWFPSAGNPHPAESVDLSKVGAKEGVLFIKTLSKDELARAFSNWEWDIPLVGKSTLFGVHKNRVIEFSVEQKWWYQPTNPNWSPETFPTTLAEFRRWWNVLEKQHFKIVFPSDIRQNFTSTKIKTGSSSKKKKTYTFQWIISGDRDKPSTEQHALYLVVDTDAIYYVSPTSLGTARINVVHFVYTEVTQQMLVDYFGNWTGNSFDSAFRDLARAARDYDALDLDEIDKIVSDEASKGSEVFEAFGMKFPAPQITIWGIFILVGVQIYFVLYLRQLRSKLGPKDAAWDVPWVGMDTSWFGQALFFISVVVFPLSALAALYGRAMSQEPRSMISMGTFFENLHSNPLSQAKFAIAFLATLILGILSWRYRPKPLNPLLPPSTPDDEWSQP